VLNETLIDASTDVCGLNARVRGGSDVSATSVTVRNRGGGAALCVSSESVDIGLLVQDSIVQSDGGTDIVAEGLSRVTVKTSIYSSLSGTADPASSGNLPGPAIFESSTDVVLRNQLADIDQPARDSATPNPDATLDILGSSRIIGPAPDRGAFERRDSCDSIFPDGFDEDACVHVRARPHSKHARPFCLPAQSAC
jgi:hypothetical protein